MNPISLILRLILPLLLPALAAAAAPERQNALEFSNGAFLVEDGGSYGQGVGSWAAWRLTDGSETQGWCSPQGKPKGLAFAWELDTTWLLEKLVLSTRNMQESSYSGVSAKLVEVLISTADGPWKSVGKFAIGKEERREHSLPAGTSAARVKLVVLDNHGNADFTELAEVELLGQRTAAVPLRKFGGDYQTNYGPIRLTQEGDQVYGCYDDSNGAAYLWGTATGRVVQLTWSQPDRREGTATFAVTRDERRLWGVWFEGGVLRGEWSGPRVPPNQGPKCTPARKGLGDALKRQGRVVLYGIRFDSGSDVPRPESSPTLQELAAALTAQKDLSVEVAGHTDTVSGEAYNLDLSNRRARSVVAWLVKAGVDEKRLIARGYGPSRPVADNATAQGRALNRRVEATVLK